MRTIQILGTGCPKCKKLTKNVQTAVRESGIECEIKKVTEINEILNFGVMMTPSLVIDGEVKATGKVLSPDQIKEYL